MKPSIFTVLALVLAIGLVQLIGKGSIPEGVFLAGLAALVIGALLPTVVAPVLVVVLIALFFRGEVGTKFFSWLGSRASVGGNIGGALGGAFGTSFNPQQNLKGS